MNSETKYQLSGTFGEVAISPHYPSALNISGIDCINSCGWHKVNDLYTIHRPRGTDDYLILYTVDGTGRAYVDECFSELTPQTVFIIPPNKKSGYFTPENGHWEFYWMHFKGLNADNILSHITSDKQYLIKAENNKLEASFKKLLYPDSPPENRGIYGFDILTDIISKLIESYQKSNISISKNAVSELTDILEKDLSTVINIEKLAAKNYMTKATLIRIFKAQTGTTPYHYQRKLRLKRAALMLAYTEKNIKEITFETGYSNTSAFSSQFRKEYGASPADYRKNNKVYQK